MKKYIMLAVNNFQCRNMKTPVFASPCLITVLLSVFLFQGSRAHGAGVTIITHGWTGNAAGWVAGMGNAISNRIVAGNFNGVAAYMLTITTPDLGITYSASVANLGPPPTATDSGETIVLLDWSQIAKYLYTDIGNDGVAQKVRDVMLTPNFFPGLSSPIAEMPIHLVGHSRGGSLVAGLAGYLGSEGIWVDHLTLLDPYPLDLMSIIGFDDEANIYTNVLFAETYYETVLPRTLANPPGFTYPDGSFARELTNFVDGISGSTIPIFFGLFAIADDLYQVCSDDHDDVHLWYHGTIDLTTPNTGGGATIDENMRENWWLPSENRGANTGFYFSRLTGGTMDGGTRPATGLRLAGAAREPVTVTATGADVWDNIEIVDFATDQVWTQGDSWGVNAYFEDLNRDATIEIGIASDANPYNAVTQALYTATTASISGNFVQPVFETSSISAPSTNYVYAKISNGTHTRYYYATGRLIVQPKATVGGPTVTISSPSPGQTVNGQQTFTGTASSSTVSVTWLNSATGASGAASGTTSWSAATIALVCGTNTITVTATDANGRMASVSISVNYDCTSFQNGLNPTQATLVYSSNPSGNGGYGLSVGYDSPSPGAGKLRSFLKFDLSAVPPGGTINSANLRLFTAASSPPSAPCLTILCYEVSSPWTQNSPTWNTQPGYYSVVSPPAACVPNTLNAVSVWDVTSFVEDWYSGSHPNYGLILLSPSAEAGDTQNERDFWASGGPLPVLVVNYTPEQTSPTVAITSPTTAATYTTNTNQILLGGTASDDYAVASVVWLNSSNDLDGVASGTPSGMNFSWSATVPLDAGPNLITVTARNQSGNSSSASITVTYTPPPSPPTNLVATAMPTNAVFLTWAASVTTGGTTVAGYLVYRNAMLVATNLSESFLDTNLTPGASYCYTVSAFDSSGSVSAPSAAACVVTPQPEVVTVVAYPTNGGTVGGSGTYVSGSQVLISAVPNAGWIFTGWSNGSTQNPRVITVPTNAVIYTAEFAEQPLLSFNVGAGQLSLNWSGTFQLQTCTNLLNPVWIDVGVSNGPFVVTMSESGRFFRLSEFVSTNSPAPPPQ